MMVDKSQGSEFDAVVVILPYAAGRSSPASRPTRPSRGNNQLIVVGLEEQRQSGRRAPDRQGDGLRERLWSTLDPLVSSIYSTWHREEAVTPLIHSTISSGLSGATLNRDVQEDASMIT